MCVLHVVCVCLIASTLGSHHVFCPFLLLLLSLSLSLSLSTTLRHKPPPSLQPIAVTLNKVLQGHHYRNHTVLTSTTPQHDSGFLASILRLLSVEPAEVLSGAKAMDSTRAVKSPFEIAQLQRSADIASQAFRATMATAYSGQNEQEIDAHLELQFRLRGASMHAYPPVVAGGANALILHYVENNQPIGAHSTASGTPSGVQSCNDMVLVDAGCEYGLYCSDITRCWPVGGTFLPEQAEVYNAVLAMQAKCLQALEADAVTSLQHLQQVSAKPLFC